MRKIIFYLVCLACSLSTSCNKIELQNTDADENTLVVFCSPELNSFTSALANEFTSQYSGKKIIVKSFDHKSFSGVPETEGKLFFIPGDRTRSSANPAPWKLNISRDAIVPVVSSGNPFLVEISSMGVTLEELSQLLSDPSKQCWNSLTEVKNLTPLKIYLQDDEFTASLLSGLTGGNRTGTEVIKVSGSEELLSSVAKDPYSLGIVRAGNIPLSGLPENISFLPVDRNNNGSVDYMEEIYDNRESLMRGLWIGKYSDELYTNIFAVSSEKPSGKTEIAFLQWILGNGQQTLAELGYSNLAAGEILSGLNLINSVPAKASFRMSDTVTGGLLLSVGFLIVILAVFPLFMVSEKKVVPVPGKYFKSAVLNGALINIPEGLYYDKTHSWAFMEKDGTVMMGIDDFLQNVSGPFTRVKMKDPGTTIRKGELILSVIQDGKHLNIYSPVSGIIKEHNESLTGNSSLINTSPYSEGWVYKIETKKWITEFQFLIPGKKYREWINGEISRLKDSIQLFCKEGSPVLQDGGEMKSGILAGLGPEAWEDFQVHFIDIHR